MPPLLTASLSAGNWRYLLTGLPLAVLFGLTVRAVGLLLAPFGERRMFSAECLSAEAEAGGGICLTVAFQDAKRLRHTAAFRSRYPAAGRIAAGDLLRIAVRTELFQAGTYPASAAELGESADDDGILLAADYRGRRRKTLLFIFLRQILLCGAALGVFLAAMHFYF